MTDVTKVNRWIWVTFQKAGFHRYPEAATEERLKDVDYLGNRHRHLFKFKVKIEITHDNRELEFHQFLNFCESLFDNRTIDIDYKSVEMLADDIHNEISKNYPLRNHIIEVSEDGECGCEIVYDVCKNA